MDKHGDHIKVGRLIISNKRGCTVYDLSTLFVYIKSISNPGGTTTKEFPNL